MQNELEELWHMADFACPGVLGNLSSFRAIWAAPVAAGRQPGADEDVQRVGEARAAELFRKAAAFMQVKDASVLTAALPPRTELVVCCALAPAQLGRYKDALLDYKRKLATKESMPLQAVTALRAVCSSGGDDATLDVLADEGALPGADFPAAAVPWSPPPPPPPPRRRRPPPRRRWGSSAC